MDKKRIIFAIVFALVTLGLGYLFYRLFFTTSTIIQDQPPLTEDETGGGSFPIAGEGGARTTTTPPTTLPPREGRDTVGGLFVPTVQPTVSQVVTDFLQNPIQGQDGIQYYSTQDGRFYKLNAAGVPELLTEEVFYNVQQVTWSPAGTEAILEYPDGSNIYYNFATKKQATLPKHWQEFSFSEESNKIAAKIIGQSRENRWLTVANPDGSGATLVEPLGDNADKVTIDWSPNRQIVAFSRTGEGLGDNREEILLVGANGENFRSLVVEGRGFESTWSESGTRLLYSVYNANGSYKPELWVVNATGESIGSGRMPLQINTWADKCTFQDDRFVYCGVPTRLENGAGFAPELAESTPDKLWRIDTQTGAKNEILLDNRDHVIGTVTVSPDGRTLYFTDKLQPGLFQVDL